MSFSIEPAPHTAKVHEQSRVKSTACFVLSNKNSGACQHRVFLGKFFANFDQLLENFDQNYEKL
jgi:hypothetical protein